MVSPYFQGMVRSIDFDGAPKQRHLIAHEECHDTSKTTNTLVLPSRKTALFLETLDAWVFMRPTKNQQRRMTCCHGYEAKLCYPKSRPQRNDPMLFGLLTRESHGAEWETTSKRLVIVQQGFHWDNQSLKHR